MVYWPLALSFTAHKGLNPDPAERIGSRFMFFIIICRSRVFPPPAVAFFIFNESKYFLFCCKPEGKVCRHSAYEIFTLMMKKYPYIAESDS
jgi:hypothetical protein